MSSGAGGSSGTPEPTPTPVPDPIPTSERPWYRNPLVAIPLALAVITVLFGDAIFNHTVKAWLTSSYVQEADEACSRSIPALKALGDEPWQEQGEVYHEYMKKRRDVILQALAAWHAVDVPPIAGGEIRDTYHIAHSAGRHFQVAVDWAENGNEDRANDFLDKFDSEAIEAIRKARALGLEVCPVGF